MGGTSRISRETYVRFCERLGVRFPGSTRRPHVCSWHSTTLPKIGRPILSNPIRWRPARRPRTEARPRRTDVSRVKKGIDKPRPVTEANLIRIYCGAHDLLAGEAIEFGTHAKSFGLDASLDCLPEGQHNFIFGAGRVPEVDQAILEMARWLQSKLGLSATHL